MHWYLAASLLLLSISTSCWSQSIIIEIDGSLTEDRQFCAGRNITLVCTISGSNAFRWTSSVFSTIPIFTADGTIAIDEYYLTAMEGRGTLSVITVMELSNVDITCTDGGSNAATISLEVFGIPSVPVISDIQNAEDLSYLIFTIVQPGTSSICVRSYNVTVFALDSGMQPSILIENVMNPSTTTIQVNLETLCEFNHTVTVAAIDIIGNMREVFANVSGITFGGVGRIQGDILGGDIVVTIPSILNGSIAGYEHTYLGTTDRFATISDKVPLSLFNNRTSCGDCIVTLSPIIKVQYAALVNSRGNVSIGITDSSSSVPIIAGVVGGCAGAALVLIILLAVCLAIKYRKPREPKDGCQKALRPNAGGPPVESDGPGLYADVKHGSSRNNPQDKPTYQDPHTITRQAAGPSGDVYTVPEKKGRKAPKKTGQSEGLPMDTVVDKSAQQEGLVYADIDTQNPRSSRSMLPPPGVTQHDANEPVLYRTVHT